MRGMCAGEVLGSGPEAPIDLNVDVGVEAETYGAGIPDFFQELDGAGFELLQGGGYFKLQVDAGDPAGGGRHGLGYMDPDAI